MDSMTLFSTPNWFLNQVMTINHDCSLVAYCVRTDIVVLRNAYAPNAFKIDSRTIKTAHKERATGCVFSPVTDVNKQFHKHLVSYGDDGAVRMWNLTNGQCVMVNNSHLKQIESGHKIVGIDWLKTDPHVIVSVSDNSVVNRWALEANTVKQYIVKGRIFPQCIAASPHNKDIVAIGAKCGNVVIFSTKLDQGITLGRVRCFDSDVMSLSWCPIASDVIYDKSDDEPKYIVAGTKDYGVHIINTNHPSKAKNDCAKTIANVHLPRTAMSKNNQRFARNYKKDHGWSVVCWCGPRTIVTTTRFAEVIKFQTEPLNTNKESLQFKFKLVHDRHKSKPILCMACPQTSEVDSGLDQVIWTLAVDRHLIRYSLQQCSLTLDLHTCTSYVFGLALSIVPDQSRLAIGLGEGKILIWNMFKRAYLDMTEIWQKIEGKVMSLSFHPSREGWLGYGTSSGSVGVVDIGLPGKGPFVMYALEKPQSGANSENEKNAVYTLQWGPYPPYMAPDESASKEPYCLYLIANGGVYMFTPTSKAFKATPPISLKPHLDRIDAEAGQPPDTRKSDLRWKPDFSAVAVANENGSIYVLSSQLELLVTILEHTKLINSLAWHPAFAYSCESPFKHWLATGSDKVKVFNVDPENLTVARQPIATLALHSQKITCVAWNPHVNGQLLSTSYDHVAQVWDVPNQAPLVSYHGHNSHVMSGLWSPLDPDVVITGSADGTVQSWRLSKQTTVRPSDKKKSKNSTDTAPVATCDTTSEEPKAEVREQSSRSKDGSHSARRPKSVFPITGNQLNEGSHLHVLVNRYIATINPENPCVIDMSRSDTKEEGGDRVSVETKKEELESDTVSMETKNEKDAIKASVMESRSKEGSGESVALANGVVHPEHETNGHLCTNETPLECDSKHKDVYPENGEKSSEKNENAEEMPAVQKDNSDMYLKFFGNREDMCSLVQAELTQHMNSKYITGALGTALWLGDFNVVVRMAMEKEELTDEIVALSQTASLKLWRECCAVYAKQLISHGQILKATNYLLAIHKVEEAVTLLLTSDLYKEALCLAKLRLPESHELITRGYAAWADHSTSHGNYPLAAHIYLVLGDGSSAMKVLNKSSDIRLHYYACMIARNLSHLTSTSDAMLSNCFKRSLEKAPLTFAKFLVDSHPNHKGFRLWYHGRERSAELLERPDGLSTWAAGAGQRNILDKIADDVREVGVAEADVETLKELITMCEGMDKAKVLVYISGHLAVSSVLPLPDRLRHVLLALKVAYKFQSRSYVFPALLNAALYPRGPLESYALLDRQSGPACRDYVTSMRAFFCDSVVSWLYYCEDKGLCEARLLDVLEHTVRGYMEDVVRLDAVQYYRARAELSELQSALCRQIVKSNIIQKVDSVENLNLFKPKQKKRASRTPSPEEDNESADTPSPEENESADTPRPEENESADTPIPEENERADIPNPEESQRADIPNPEESQRADIPNPEESQRADTPNPELEGNGGEKEEANQAVKEENHVVKQEENVEVPSVQEDVGDLKQKVEANGDGNEVKRDEEVKPEANLEEANDEQNEKQLENKKRPNGEEEVNEIVEKKPKLDQESERGSVNDLQDFEKATNPKYDVDCGSDKEEEEELTSEEKVQRIKQLQETITRFEESRVYSPNPGHLFDLVFKVLKTLNLDDGHSSARIRELRELMQTHAEAFEIA